MGTTFAALMTLERLGGDHFAGPPSPDKGETLFGGQLLAQCLVAAAATIDGDRPVHSLHAYFLRPGDVDAPVEIEVERVRQGRAFSSRQVQARQQGKERFRMAASFQAPENSPAYCGAPMPDAPPPEEVDMTYDDFALAELGASSWPASDRPMDTRYVNPPQARGEAVTAPQLMWMRVRAPLPADAALHQAGIAYLSDATLSDNALLPHGRRWHDPDLDGTSLDHCMWFHRPAKADEWLLFEQTAVVTGGGRGLVQGRFFDRSGNLVATCVQEALLRWS